MRVIPNAMTAWGEVLVTSFCESPAQAREVTDAVIQAAPVASAEKPRTCCM